MTSSALALIWILPRAARSHVAANTASAGKRSNPRPLEQMLPRPYPGRQIWRSSRCCRSELAGARGAPSCAKGGAKPALAFNDLDRWDGGLPGARPAQRPASSFTPPSVRHYAARNSVRNRSAAALSCRAWSCSSSAEFSMSDDAFPVLPTAASNCVISDDTCRVAREELSMLLAISRVTVPCSSTAEAIAEENSEILRMTAVTCSIDLTASLVAIWIVPTWLWISSVALLVCPASALT